MSRFNNNKEQASVPDEMKDDWKEWSTYKKMKDAQPYGYMAPAYPALQKSMDLPSKTIKVKPELLPPYTTVSINPEDEVLDLEELKQYGRYAIIEHDERYNKRFLIADAIAPPKEVENPQYAEAVEYNRQVEIDNRLTIERYEAELAAYNRGMEQEKRSINGDGPVGRPEYYSLGLKEEGLTKEQIGSAKNRFVKYFEERGYTAAKGVPQSYARWDKPVSPRRK